MAVVHSMCRTARKTLDRLTARLTEPVGDGMMTDCVAYAEPPATVPSTVFHRRQRDQRLRSLSQPDRLGRSCWGTFAQGVEGRDDSP